MADELDFPEGKTLIKEAERGREFLVLIEGTVDVSRKGRRLPALGRADCIGDRTCLGCPADCHCHYWSLCALLS